jgi:hypothetical protein
VHVLRVCETVGESCKLRADGFPADVGVAMAAATA